VEALVDSVMQAHVGPSRDIPGAVVSIVEGRSVVLAKGYGMADVEAGRPADPATTLFGIGSVTKLFTSTAAMRLVEIGQVDLHADISRYLDGVRVPERFGRPITLHHLLTHTPGFENRFIGMAAQPGEHVQPLGDYLRANLPRRVRRPGTVISYSNHGMALAGHLIASSQDTSYDAAMRQSVFEPLGMRRSTPSRRMLPDSLRSDVATTYQPEGGGFAALPAGRMHIAPAGAALTTARDAARFMIAHLNDGQAPDGEILRPATVRQMHAQQFTHHPDLAGWAYGFMESARPGPRIIMHGGGGTGYTALLWLAPAYDIGVFVACNANNDALQNALFDALTAHLFGPPREHPSVKHSTNRSALDADAARWAGTYRHVRHARSTLEKLLALTMQVQVVATDSGLVAEGLASSPVQLRPEGNGQLRRADGGRVVFEERTEGPAFLFVDETAAPAYERIPTWETLPVQGAAVGGTALVFVLAVAGAAVGWWRELETLSDAQWTAGAVGGLHLAFFAGFPAVMLLSPAGPVFFTGPPPALKAVLVLPLLALAATAYLGVTLVGAWRRGAGSLRARLGLLVVVVSSLLNGVVLHTWNLVGWQF
jgi:CubicO group peptidase (beta-lactamase class C family)